MQEKTHILSQSSWWMINKALTLKLGIDASILLSDLLSKWEYFEKRGMLDSDGAFFNRREDLMKDTTIPLYRQNKALEILISHNLVKTSNKGIPPKTRFIIMVENINKLIMCIHGME